MKAISFRIISLFFMSALVFTYGQNRYESEIFSSYQLQSNIQFGRSTAVSGSVMDLMQDIYTGTGDTVKNRPLIIFIHGGGFKDGDKISSFGTLLCGGFAKRGYVVASINYRLGTTNTLETDYEAMLRAVQDGKAAVRFFRRYSALYGIDTSQIFVTGSSAGSITALHMAYLRQNEIPSYVNLAGLGGTLEGTSGNAGFSSEVQGVISNWGALVDYHYMKAGDVPVFCVHGLSDVTVPCDSSFADGPFQYGSIIINNYANTLGVKTGIRLFDNTGHTLDNNTSKQDSAYNDMSAWLYTLLKQTTGIKSQGGLINPDSPILKQNYPNPFNPTTTLEYQISKPGFVQLYIYDSLGRIVDHVVNQYQNAGSFKLSFNGSSLSSGIYYAQLSSSSNNVTQKMILLK